MTESHLTYVSIRYADLLFITCGVWRKSAFRRHLGGDRQATPPKMFYRSTRCLIFGARCFLWLVTIEYSILLASSLACYPLL